jgi:predicted MFS family arabinose efflux permease
VSTPRVTPLWRNRDFVLLLGGQVVSTVGTRISSLAFPLLVLSLTHSPAKAGFVGFAQTIPYLIFFLPAGALVDRWDRKRVMLVCDAARAAAFASIAIALGLDSLAFAHIVVVAFVEGSFFVFFFLSESAALPHVVSPEQIPAAVASNQARVQGADLAGQPLGGVLFGLSRTLPFVVDAVSYAISFVSLLFVRPSFQERRERPKTHLVADVQEGLGWLWRQPLLRAAVLLIAGSNFAFAGFTLALIVRARDLGAAPSLVGAMFAFVGGGAVVGSILAPWVQRHVPARFVIVGDLWLWAVAMAVVVLPGSPLAIGVIAGIAAIGGPIFNVVFASYRYALVPDRLLGRVQSASLVVAWGMTPLGALATGLMLQSLGAAHTLLALAGISGALALVATAIRAVRTAPRLETLATEAAE